jgi:hypothetical protein
MPILYTFKLSTMNTHKFICIVAIFLFAGAFLHASAPGFNRSDENQPGTYDNINQRRPFLQEKMHPNDLFIVTLFSDFWQDLPGDMDLKSIQRGISIAALQDMPLGRTNFSLAAGLGFTSHNLYSDHRYLHNPSNDAFEFFQIAENHEYDKNKLSLNYLEIPVQFRYRSRELPRSFRLYAGVKAGRLINAHTKFVGKEHWSDTCDGDGTEPPDTSRKAKIKEHRLKNIADYRIGITGTIGYGSINLRVYYPLTDIFTENSAEDARPLSLGVSFILF